ncbi:MAG: histone deacetylase family protein [Thermoleophilaceae bacterium]
MVLYSHDRFTFPLPPRHRFPLGKYGLLRERVIALGLVAADEVVEPDPVGWDDLLRVHSAALVERMRAGGLTRREELALGLPWSPELVERARRATGGTVAAARDAVAHGMGMNLGGGTHHAGYDTSRGYCLVNDVVVAVAALRNEGRTQRMLVVDCDVHQGDGTAELLAGDGEAFSLSVHCAVNYPFRRAQSDLDVDLPRGAGDDAYLTALSDALDPAVHAARPDLAFFLAGADPWEGDALGRLALTKEGLRARDELVLDRLALAGATCCVVLAGGYAPDVRDTVEINAATVAAAVRRAPGGTRTLTPPAAAPGAPAAAGTAAETAGR